MRTFCLPLRRLSFSLDRFRRKRREKRRFCQPDPAFHEKSPQTACARPRTVRKVLIDAMTQPFTRRLAALRNIPELEADVGPVGRLRVPDQVALVVAAIRPYGIHHLSLIHI